MCERAGQRSRYSDWLQAGQSGDRIPVGARFPAPVQTGPGAHPASCTMGTGSLPGGKSVRGVTLTPHPFQCRGQERVELLPLPLWAIQPVQSLSACTRVHFTFTLLYLILDVYTKFRWTLQWPFSGDCHYTYGNHH